MRKYYRGDIETLNIVPSTRAWWPSWQRRLWVVYKDVLERKQIFPGSKDYPSIPTFHETQVYFTFNVQIGAKTFSILTHTPPTSDTGCCETSNISLPLHACSEFPHRKALFALKSYLVVICGNEKKSASVYSRSLACSDAESEISFAKRAEFNLSLNHNFAANKKHKTEENNKKFLIRFHAWSYVKETDKSG